MKETMDMRFDLKKPCNDCPFRIGAPFHEGVLKDLPELHSGLERGTIAHSCHKTDPRADSEEGQKYKGPVQHCAGLLLMMNNNVEMMGDYQASAWSRGDWNPLAMDKSVKVFKDLGRMLKHYLDGWEKKSGKKWKDLLDERTKTN